MINLVKNALKFTKRGYIRILVGYDETRELLKVQVCDSGAGVALEEIPQLCYKFGKLFRTAEMNHDGIGLGLMISKAIIEKNGGQLDIFSKGVNQGSVFTFSMKMSKQDPKSITNKVDQNDSPLGRLKVSNNNASLVD